MDGITYAEWFFALVLTSGVMWAAIFGFAFRRRQFGQPFMGYVLGFVVTWLGTVTFFVMLTIWERQTVGN